MRVHAVEHVDFERAANIAAWALKNGHQLTRSRFYRPEDPPTQDDFDWLIIMGGPMGAYEEKKFPWLIREKAFIVEAIKANKIVFGICLGAQLIADVIGGRVYKNAHKEIGWFPVTLTEEGRRSPIFKGLPEKFVPINWHGDTFDLPPEAKRLAFSEATPNQAFVFRGKVVGLQFHMEWSSSDVDLIISKMGNDLAEGKYVETPEKLKGTSKNLLRSEILIPSSETRKMSEKTGGVAGSYVDGFFVKSDEVAAEGAKLQPKEVFRGALKSRADRFVELKAMLNTVLNNIAALA